MVQGDLIPPIHTEIEQGYSVYKTINKLMRRKMIRLIDFPSQLRV